MLDRIPTGEELESLLGEEKYRMWTAVCALIDGLYQMETAWNGGGKQWDYEYKYRRGGKTLCALYARKGGFGLLIILGKAEREAFENASSSYSPAVVACYNETKTYHDGKWMLLEPTDPSQLDDIKHLLQIKRKPNRK